MQSENKTSKGMDRDINGGAKGRPKREEEEREDEQISRNHS